MFKRTQIHLTKTHLFGTSCQSYHLILTEFMKKWQNLPKNLKQQLEHVRLQKKIAFNKYQSQQRHKISQDQDIYLPGTCTIMGDSILNGLIEENISKQHNVRIRKFPGATVDDLNYHVHPTLRKKLKHIIVHIGTSNATRSRSREILHKLLKLKNLIKETLPETEVTFSTPRFFNSSTNSKKPMRPLSRLKHGYTR